MDEQIYYIFCLLATNMALLTAHVLSKKIYLISEKGRFESIDGLRGFLAFFVFLHHVAIWKGFLETDSWTINNFSFADHLGGSSVIFFFMITSFLFTTKILNSENNFDWKQFVRSRFFRIMPLYTVVVAIVVFISFAKTNFTLQETPSDLAKNIFHWLTFGIVKYPAINGFQRSFLIPAGAVWSLRWEWLFYFSLPVIFIILKRKFPPLSVLLISIALCAFCFMQMGKFYYIFFAGGMVAPLISFYLKPKINFNKNYYSILIIMLLVLLMFTHARSYKSGIIITVIFTSIALGNNLWGLLKRKELKFLGEISYSTYLLHGILLFTVFRMILSPEYTAKLSDKGFYGIVLILAPILVIISTVFFLYVEKPFINLGKKKECNPELALKD